MASIRKLPIPAQAPSDHGKQSFLDRARQLPGVLKVETFGGNTLAEQSFRVYIAEGDTETERRVYALKGDVYDQHPDARLDVWIEEASPVAFRPQPQTTPQ